MTVDPTNDPTALKIAAARGAILALEVAQARAVREFILGDATAVGRLRAIDNLVIALRAQLTP